MLPGLHFSFSQPSKSTVLRGWQSPERGFWPGWVLASLPGQGSVPDRNRRSPVPSPAPALLSTGTATGALHSPTHFNAASLTSTSPGGANYDYVNEAEVLMLPRVLMTFLQVFCYFYWKQKGSL